MLLRPEMVEPPTLGEAIAVLRRRPGAVAMAGATDLIPNIRRGLARPELLVNLKRIPGLSGVRRVRGGVRVGTLTKVAELLRSPLLDQGWPLLVEVAREFGSPQIRNLATIGGNICNATPSADFPLSLLVTDARLEIQGPRGAREMAIADFFRDVNEVALRRGEVVTAIFIPRPPPRTGLAQVKLGVRRAMDLATVAVAAAITLAPHGQVCRRARVALGAVAPIPMRSLAAESLLAGEKLTAGLLAEAGRAAAAEARPVSDLRASAEYRREMTAVLARRALTRAWRRAWEGI